MSIAQGFWLRTLIVEVCRYPLRPPGPSYQIVKVGRVVPEQPSYAATSCVRAANSASIAAVEGQAALAATAGAAVATTAVGRVQAGAAHEGAAGQRGGAHGVRFRRGVVGRRSPFVQRRRSTRGPGDRRGAHSSTAPGMASRGGEKCESRVVGVNVQVSAW